MPAATSSAKAKAVASHVTADTGIPDLGARHGRAGIALWDAECLSPVLRQRSCGVALLPALARRSRISNKSLCGDYD
jgi:hypothetical protein